MGFHNPFYQWVQPISLVKKLQCWRQATSECDRRKRRAFFTHTFIITCRNKADSLTFLSDSVLIVNDIMKF